MADFKRAVTVEFVFGEDCHVESQMDICGIF